MTLLESDDNTGGDKIRKEDDGVGAAKDRHWGVTSGSDVGSTVGSGWGSGVGSG